MFAKGWRARRDGALKRNDKKIKMASFREVRAAHAAAQAAAAAALLAGEVVETEPEAIPSVDESSVDADVESTADDTSDELEATAVDDEAPVSVERRKPGRKPKAS